MRLQNPTRKLVSQRPAQSQVSISDPILQAGGLICKSLLGFPGRDSHGILALTRPFFALSLGGSRRKALWLSISARAENRCDDGGCIHRSLSRISLFFFLRDRPESVGDHTPYRQQTLGSSCLPWSYPHRWRRIQNGSVTPITGSAYHRP